MKRALSVSLTALVIAISAASCALMPAPSGCRIIGAKQERDPAGYYVVTLLLKNGSPQPVDLADLRFELTTFDNRDRILDESFPFTSKGEIDRFDIDSIRLHLADREERIRRSHVFMRDRAGRVLSDWAVGIASVRGGSERPTSSAPGYLGR